jgi:hypothetical protein
MKKTLVGLLLACCFAAVAHGQKAPLCKAVNDLTPITVAGNYCLKKTLVGTGLVIDANDVTLDLKGYSIINSQVAVGHLTSWANQVGIRSENRNNITVKNGTVSGFDFGVRLGYPAGVRGSLLVENLLIRGSKATGISVLGYDSVIVRNNTVVDTIGPGVFGIQANGRDDPLAGGVNNSTVLVEGNRVINTHSVGTTSFVGQTTLGILSEGAADTRVSDNLVTDVSCECSNYVSTGILLLLQFPRTSLVDDNIVLNPKLAPGPSKGIHVQQGTNPAYTGPVALYGTVIDSRVYNFKEGITALSQVGENGTLRRVVSILFTRNVVGGATLNAYYGGELGSNNRTE